MHAFTSCMLLLFQRYWSVSVDWLTLNSSNSTHGWQISCCYFMTVHHISESIGILNFWKAFLWFAESRRALSRYLYLSDRPIPLVSLSYVFSEELSLKTQSLMVSGKPDKPGQIEVWLIKIRWIRMKTLACDHLWPQCLNISNLIPFYPFFLYTIIPLEH